MSLYQSLFPMKLKLHVRWRASKNTTFLKCLQSCPKLQQESASSYSILLKLSSDKRVLKCTVNSYMNLASKWQLKAETFHFFRCKY